MFAATWLGHSTFLFDVDGHIILLDPFVEQNPTYPKGFTIERFDTMLLTHGHSDHTADAIPLAKKHKPQQIVAMFELAEFLEGKGVQNTLGMNKGGTTQVGPLRVTMTHAFHSSSMQDGDQKVYVGEPAGFVLHLPDGRRVYLAGDTALFGDMQLIAELYQPEIAFLPIGDLYTMGPREAAYACKLLRVKTAVPIHYKTFPVLTGTPEAFQQEIAALGLPTQVLNLEPGEPQHL